MNEALKELVYTAMQNAIDNGHVFMGATDLAVAIDLCDNDSDLEEYEPEQLARYVTQFIWQQEVDRVKAFITAGDYASANDRIDMFLPDIKRHIENYLPISMLIDLNHWRTENGNHHVG